MRPAFVFLLCSIFPCSFEGRQWNNDINSWTELNGLLLEGGLVAWGNPDYGGTPNEPIGYAGSESDRLSQYVDRTTAPSFFSFFLFPPLFAFPAHTTRVLESIALVNVSAGTVISAPGPICIERDESAYGK